MACHGDSTPSRFLFLTSITELLRLGHARQNNIQLEVRLPLLGRSFAAPSSTTSETHCLFAVDHDVIKSSVTKQRAAGGGTAAARQARD